MHGFIRLSCAVPTISVADVDANIKNILSLITQAQTEEAAVVVFPELCLTGYSCGDLFFQDQLQTATLEGLNTLLTTLGKKRSPVTIIGCPLRHRDRLYNCAVVIHQGKIQGIVPKSYLPDYKEYYEQRWFKPGKELVGDTIEIFGTPIPFGVDLLFPINHEAILGVEICEDLWNVIPPSCHHALAGATIIANLSASNELVAKADYRRELVRHQSARCVCAYVYSSSGVTESTTDLVFGGHCLIAENGILLAENERFIRSNQLLCGDIDSQRLTMSRLSETCFKQNQPASYRHIPLTLKPTITRLQRVFDPHPFIPRKSETRNERCQEIFQIQAAGLAKRWVHTQAHTMIIGISGGLDSTLALLAVCETAKLLKKENDSIITVTMPGFGTSSKTLSQAVKLCLALNTNFREISIRDACNQHYKDINHDPKCQDTTFENIQARTRTLILMNLANQNHGLVVGTGDLSELALGWSTYNGDHMSMYGINSGIPKTLVQYIIKWVADHSSTELMKILIDILNTPISPELTEPKADGSIGQETEKIIGPFQLHDFFLYHLLKYGASPAKIRFLAIHAFAGQYQPEVIDRWLAVFLKRFFSNQYKRSCLPDGPKVGTIGLSPRGDWRMPSDASATAWLAFGEE